MDAPPRLSVAIFWRDAGEDLSSTLAALSAQEETAPETWEILVVSSVRPAREMMSRVGNVRLRWIAVDPPATEPRAWHAAAAAARGEIIAFTQARCRPAPCWVRAILAHAPDDHTVLAGPVDPGPQLAIGSLMAFLCDYSAFCTGNDPGPRLAASSNVAFRRSALRGVCGEEAIHKCRLLGSRRFRVRWCADQCVTLEHSAAALARRFHRARHFAADRACAWSRLARSAAGIACIGLPWLLWARIVSGRAIRSRFGGALLVGQPWLVSGLIAWSLGELAGYWTGAGASEQFL